MAIQGIVYRIVTGVRKSARTARCGTRLANEIAGKGEETCGYVLKSIGHDTVQINKKVKSADTFIEMIEHFSSRHPEKNELVKNLAIRGVETHPTDTRLIALKYAYIDDSQVLISDLSSAISLKPTAKSYFMRYQTLLEQGKSKEAVADLKKALEYAKMENRDPEFISEIENMLSSNVSSTARKLKPLPITDEQKIFNARVDEYWNKYQREINDVFEEKRFFSLSGNNCTTIETTAKNHLQNSIKQIGKVEDFGLTKDTLLYHGTTPEARNLIETYGFDLSKCGTNKGVETGKGIYLGFDEKAIRKVYGSDVVIARFTGENIAKVEPGVYGIVAGGDGCITPLKLNLIDRLGLDMCNGNDNKLVDEIISRYYNNLLENKKIQGIITDVSYNAGMGYFVVPNPSKYLEIL